MASLTLLLLSAVVAPVYCSPLIIPTSWPEAPTGTITLAPVPTQSGCTTTWSQTISNPCSWDGTLTLYPTTTVSYRQVDCHGCDYIVIPEQWDFCPNQRINATLRLDRPSTSWSTVCTPTPTLGWGGQQSDTDTPVTTPAGSNTHHLTGPPTPPPHPTRSSAARRADAVAEAACTTTYYIDPPQTAGPVLTKYASTTTLAVGLDCGGCVLTTSTALLGYGPPAVFTTTVTRPVSTATTYTCQ